MRSYNNNHIEQLNNPFFGCSRISMKTNPRNTRMECTNRIFVHPPFHFLLCMTKRESGAEAERAQNGGTSVRYSTGLHSNLKVRMEETVRTTCT